MADSVPSGSSGKSSLQDQRDRFVAFAFAGADLLLEIDEDGVVTYAAGMTELLLGRPSRELTGQLWTELVRPVDRFTMAEALRRIARGGRFDSLKITLAPPAEGQPGHDMVMSGLCADNDFGICHLSLRKLGGAALAATATAPQPGERIDTEDFVAMVQQRLRSSEHTGDDYSLTLVDVPRATGMTADEAKNFFATVEGYLRAMSVGGTSVGRLREDKFGVLSEKALDGEETRERITHIAQEIDPDGAPPRIHTATLGMKHDDLSQADLTKALVYTINKFVAEGGEMVSITSLSEGYRAALDDTLTRVAHFRSVIHSDKLMFAYQPIIEIERWRIHHYEALARVRQNGQIFLPSSFVTFAEDVGVVNELDMIVCRRALETLRTDTCIQPGGHLAINLSGRSISNSAFVQRLLKLLTDNSDLMPRLLFEITESAEMHNLDEANWVVQRLRKLGCRLCLDDFGAGAASFPYLRALEVDFVKIDGSYIMDAFDTHYGLPFLRAMAQLCNDLKIATIGEMVEDAKTVKLLRNVGIDMAQGYYFCRPDEDVSNYRMPPKPGGRKATTA
ncbi:MAG TPA: EAL domain-containing protein [Candidatus Sulfotelmatobacter sp.]|jgi:EAL domain-containing protein (putative c-di-GMP-specific phosphodiesterase class I)|nr:EAL domain-containing protein [Candidatus Sulfotelmatobacter sp.]